MSSFRNTIRRTFLGKIARSIRATVYEEMEIKAWEKAGKPVPPPPIVKQRTVKNYAKRFSIQTLIETGTYNGDMVYACKGCFNRVFSVELGKDLYERAKARFSGFDHITIVHGDSGKVLPQILASVQGPCLFWLDAHYSGGLTAKGELDTPILQELELVLGSSCAEQHIILIDDARCFIGRDGYPTIEELVEVVHSFHPGWGVQVDSDIIRIHTATVIA